MEIERDLSNLQNAQEQIAEAYKTLSVKAELVYEFVILYHEYIYSSHGYGAGIDFTMMEIHTLTHIEDNPGVTITELAKMWNKTKSAVSQTVKKLVEGGFVERKNMNNNQKTILLYVTESGKKASLIHKAYDVLDINETMSHLNNQCGEANVKSFFNVLEKYVELLKQ